MLIGAPGHQIAEGIHGSPLLFKLSGRVFVGAAGKYKRNQTDSKSQHSHQPFNIIYIMRIIDACGESVAMAPLAAHNPIIVRAMMRRSRLH